ncbi:ABC transporter substrate-binding protein [Paenibacillus rhizoplanae]
MQNNNYTAGIKIRLLGGEPMDVFDTWSPSLFEEFRALRSDMYLDLTGADFLKEFYPNSLLPVTVGGRVYGAPEVMHSDGLLYNKTLFDSLGLEVPRTWDEFLALCVKLKQEGLIPVAMDAEWSTAQFFWGGLSCRITGRMPPGPRSWRAGRSGPMIRCSWMPSRSTGRLSTGDSCRPTGRA